MNFKSYDLKEFRNARGLLLDVRSPEEYYKGHMPNSINIPLFNNEERSIIGKKYKNAGRQIAVKEGFKIIENNLDNLIEEIFFAINNYLNLEEFNNKQTIRIYCARGGMRSQSIGWLMERFSYPFLTLNGGYKSYRNWVLKSFVEKKRIIVIGGKTGTRKTKILQELKSLNYQVLDLETLANHRGSSFGGLGMKKQPTNEQFENLISENLANYDNNQIVFVEAESPNIGRNRIPHELYNQMKISKRIEIVRDDKVRIDELISTYSFFSKDDLKDSVVKITKRLGNQRTRDAINSIEREDWEAVCYSVLEYYDKCYEYELKNKKDVKILKMGFKNDEEIIEEIIKSIQV